MDINIKYDVADISAQLIADVSKAVNASFEQSKRELIHDIKTAQNDLISGLIIALDIKDDKQKNKLKKQAAAGLDKWLKGSKL